MKNKFFLLFFGLAIFIASSLISCSTPSDLIKKETVPVGKKISSADLLGLIYENGISPHNIYLTDTSYTPLKIEWVTGAFSEKLSKFLFDFDIRDWAAEKNDCDSLSKAATVYCSILYSNSRTSSSSGVGFGEFYYVKAGKGGHAINIIVCETPDKKIKLHFYDPQLRMEVFLSEKERSLSILTLF